jgi:hypothetical protein
LRFAVSDSRYECEEPALRRETKPSESMVGH